MSFKIQSSGFQNDGLIPAKYTGEGENISPPLEWSGLPRAVKELALVCEDPDAKSETPFVHWIVYHIPPTITSLHEGLEPKAHPLDAPVAGGFFQGRNSFGQLGYCGPKPPAGGGLHHYHFKLFALGTELKLEAGASREDFFKAIEGHVRGQADLVGTYRARTQSDAWGSR